MIIASNLFHSAESCSKYLRRIVRLCAAQKKLFYKPLDQKCKSLLIWYCDQEMPVNNEGELFQVNINQVRRNVLQGLECSAKIKTLSLKISDFVRIVREH